MPEPPEGEDQIEIDPMSLTFKIDSSLVYKELKKVLTRNDCRNRGYILDGYPRNYSDAQNIFLKWKDQVDEDGNPVDEPIADEDDDTPKDWS